MLIRKATTILLIVTLFSVGIGTYGQSAQSNAQKIRELREEITKRETANVPGDLVELNRSKLIERRAELRTLLKVEIDSLRRHRALLGSSITSEESQKIDESIEDYVAELNRLRIAIQSDLASEGTEQTGSSALVQTSNPESIENSRVAKANSSAGEVAVASSNSGSGLRSSNGTGTSVSQPAAPSEARLDLMPAGSSDVKDTNATVNCKEALEGDKRYSELERIICGLARDIPQQRADRKFSKNQIFLGLDQRFELIKILIAKKATPAFLVEAEDKRLDKQVGGAPANAGSGSLVVKGGAPAILGFAVENGGLSRSTSGSAITFRGNPVGLINMLRDKGFVTGVKEAENDPIQRFLRKTSFAFTFNTDRGPQPGVFTASKQQLSSASARIELINRRQPKRYIKDWEDFLADKAQHFADVINNSQFVDASDPNNPKWIDPALQAWFVQTQSALGNATDAEVSSVLQASLDKLPIKDLSPQTVQELSTIERELGLYMSGRDDVLNKINTGTLVTFEYLNKREVNAPDTSNFTFIAEKGTQGGKLDFTLNSSLTMFNNLGALRNFVAMNPTLPQPRRVRDFQFSGQMDYALGNVRDFGQVVLFAGGRYERLLEDASTDLGMVLPNTKGDIGYLQVGVKVPIKGTGFKIPFSVTFANRSELVKERHVRGNFGFSLDLDTLFAKFKPF